jgi:hypothetical protein
MGVPLINAIYEDDPLVGLYTLPLLIWHPMQLLVGSTLAPRLAKFVETEEERLGISPTTVAGEADDGQNKEQLIVKEEDEESGGLGATEREDKDNASSEESQTK